MRRVILASILCGCAGPLHHINRVGLASAVAATACDWGQTSWAMSSGGFQEQNTTLGIRPSQATLGAYMLGSAALTTAAWYLLPERLKPLAWGVPLFRESDAVSSNMREGAPFCGLSGGGPATLARTR